MANLKNVIRPDQLTMPGMILHRIASPADSTEYTIIYDNSLRFKIDKVRAIVSAESDTAAGFDYTLKKNAGTVTSDTNVQDSIEETVLSTDNDEYWFDVGDVLSVAISDATNATDTVANCDEIVIEMDVTFKERVT